MTSNLDETHDPGAESWIPSANSENSDFPLQNLPFGVFQRKSGTSTPAVGVAIGNQIADLKALHSAGLLADRGTQPAAEACAEPSLNALMRLGTGPRRALRRSLFALLSVSASPSTQQAAARHLLPQSDADMLLPAVVGDYTDFYASIFHATNVGKLFRPDNPLLPNYKFIPIGYHGRASSVIASDTPVPRPCGQTREGDNLPKFGPTQALDYEMEVGFFVSAGNAMGNDIPIASAEDHIFGICLVNDWSARDIQAWEYQPLGPFLAKSFATSLSSWIVTTEALAPFHAPAFERAEGDPAPLPYLRDDRDQKQGGLDVWLEVSLSSERMRRAGDAPLTLGRSNLRDMYWTIAQMLAHHASNGCNLRPGDLLATGTVSGAGPTARGCLLELTSRGKDPVTLPNGEQRKFLEDGDEVTLTGYCEKAGYRRIGLGSCRGIVAPSPASCAL